MRYTIMFLYVLMNLSCAGQSAGDEKQVNLSTGVGMTDWYYLAVKYQVNQMQFGLSYGTNPFKSSNGNFRVLSIFGYKHLFGQSKLTERKPWFIRSGLSYISNEFFKDLIDRKVYGTIYFGRDINLSHRIGLAISFGPTMLLYSEYDESIKPSFLLPGMDVNLFYRFL